MSMLSKGVGGGRRSVFSPLNISGIEAWYDAQSQTGFAHGAAVTSATDFSGNGRTLVNSTVASQPAFTTAGIGGRASFVLDVDVLRATLTPALVQPISIVGVAMATSGINNRQIDGGDGNTSRCVNYLHESSHRIFAGTVMSANLSVTTGAAFDFYSLFSGTNSKIKIGTNTTVVGNAGTNGHDRITFGNDVAEVAPWEGQIGEYIIYSTSLSTEEVTQLRSYFASRWGL